MLLFTPRLRKYIENRIFPKILIVPDKYYFEGDFKNEDPYITDIDVINDMYPEINKNNIYENISKLINELGSLTNIILVYIRLGDHFLDPKNIPKKKILMLENSVLVFKYIIKIESYLVQVNVVANYGYKKVLTQKQKEKYSNGSKKLGLYKQLLCRIDTYKLLYSSGKLNIKMATDIMATIVHDVEKLPFMIKTDVVDMVREIAMDNSPDNKIQGWYVLLDDLQNDINGSMEFFNR
ncbi:MAG: hypothetical protein Satyrvirus17_16 [Satyrvirus sp.]|uniref:Uncharacterized protein n=1 Tax=Satyrvirus sp. TaxID=2487771 RepID=A0A3G5AE06_9VIRU|nr:MAG: hypothetical protein Satyrvirus17_16 [Satyrvirus sp.]